MELKRVRNQKSNTPDKTIIIPNVKKNIFTYEIFLNNTAPPAT